MEITVCDLCEDPDMFMSDYVCSICDAEACIACIGPIAKHGQVCLICAEDLPASDFTAEEKENFGVTEE